LNNQLSFSRKIISVNYDPGTETLEISFNTGSVYVYANVPESLYDTLKLTKNPDLFFDQKIFGQFELKKSF
jgi:hypothetical protein